MPVISVSGPSWIQKRKNTKMDYMRTAKELFLQAYKNGETSSPAMYNYCCEKEMNMTKVGQYGNICLFIGLSALLVYAATLYDRWKENGHVLRSSEVLELTEWTLLFTVLAILVVVIALDVIVWFAKRRARIKKNDEKKGKK